MSKNNNHTIDDCTRTTEDQPDENNKSTTARSKKVQRKRKVASKPILPKPSPTTPSTAASITDDQRTDTATDKRSNRSESTNRSTSSISSSRNENESAAAASLPSQPHRSGFKRFFLKVSEKMGGVEQTHYSAEFNETVQEIDNYKLCLEDLLKNLVLIIQRNSKLQARPLEKLEYEYQENTNPYELLYPAMKDFCGFLNGTEPKKQLEMAAKLGALHRGFHRRSRRCLRNIRKFLCEDYDIICEARKSLNDRRQEMDFAKHELKNAKTPEVVQMKNSVYENSQKHFESQLQKVLALLDQLPKMKDSHLKDVQTFHAIYKVYHEQMSQVLTSSK